MLAEEARVAGTPNVVSVSEFAKAPGTPIFRGVSRKEWAESYLSGDFRATYGMADVGVYFFGAGPKGAALAAAEDYGIHIIRAKIVQGARIVPMDELVALAQAYRVQVHAELERLAPDLLGQTPSTDELSRAVDRLLDDSGNYAIIAGIDGWTAEFYAPEGQNVKYYTVVNRQATLVEG